MVAGIYVSCAAAFLFDVTHLNEIAFGIFYVPMVWTAIFYEDSRAEWWLAGIAAGMVAVGFVLPEVPADITEGVINRALSIFAIIGTAGYVHYERRTRARLAEQTRRAELADRAKTQIFTNLSHELRTPLNAVVGFADLLARDARPDQRSALGHIQSAGARLLSTFENLIDLTRLDERRLRAEPVDLITALEHAYRAHRAAAAEKSVTLRIDATAQPLPRAHADGWAVRRILENVVGNAVKFTPPGGTVQIHAEHAGDRIAAVVRDTGPGMSPEVVAQLGELFFQADTSASRYFEGLGTGLALSMRLAARMGARLTFQTRLGDGTTVRLDLPADLGPTAGADGGRATS